MSQSESLDLHRARLLAATVRSVIKKYDHATRAQWVLELPCVPPTNCYSYEHEKIAVHVDWIVIGSTAYGVYVEIASGKLYATCLPADTPPTLNHQPSPG